MDTDYSIRGKWISNGKWGIFEMSKKKHIYSNI